MCRGWWRLVLWYVRLRRASKKKVYHTDLLKVERMAGPSANYPNPVAVVRNASLRPQDIEEIKENRELEESIESENTESEEEDLEDFYRRETAKYRSAQAKREFFSGIRFQLRMDSFQLILNSLKRQILREDEIYPNWHFVTNNICLKAGFNNEDMILNFSVREVTMMDYFRSEATQLIVNYASNKILKTQGVESDDLTSYD